MKTITATDGAHCNICGWYDDKMEGLDESINEHITATQHSVILREGTAVFVVVHSSISQYLQES